MESMDGTIWAKSGAIGALLSDVRHLKNNDLYIGRGNQRTWQGCSFRATRSKSHVMHGKTVSDCSKGRGAENPRCKERQAKLSSERLLCKCNLSDLYSRLCFHTRMTARTPQPSLHLVASADTGGQKNGCSGPGAVQRWRAESGHFSRDTPNMR